MTVIPIGRGPLGRPEIGKPVRAPRVRVTIADTTELTAAELAQLQRLVSHIALINASPSNKGAFRVSGLDDPNLWQVLMEKLDGADRVSIQRVRQG